MSKDLKTEVLWLYKEDNITIEITKLGHEKDIRIFVDNKKYTIKDYVIDELIDNWNIVKLL